MIKCDFELCDSARRGDTCSRRKAGRCAVARLSRGVSACAVERLDRFARSR